MKIRLITRPINKIKQVILDFIHHNHIINWTPLQKSALMLTLACAMNFSWILWKGYILITPSIWQWANLSLVESQIWLNLLTLFFISCTHYSLLSLQRPSLGAKNCAFN